jgi:hypothetical protein
MLLLQRSDLKLPRNHYCLLGVEPEFLLHTAPGGVQFLRHVDLSLQNAARVECKRYMSLFLNWHEWLTHPHDIENQKLRRFGPHDSNNLQLPLVLVCHQIGKTGLANLAQCDASWVLGQGKHQ